jgi:small subunit ribosomal protein S6
VRERGGLFPCPQQTVVGHVDHKEHKMSQYELVVILPLETEPQTQGREKILADLAIAGAVVEKTDEMGDRDLAYEISGIRRARYVLFHLKAEPAKIAALDKVFKLNSHLVRYLFVKKHEKERV